MHIGYTLEIGNITWEHLESHIYIIYIYIIYNNIIIYVYSMYTFGNQEYHGEITNYTLWEKKVAGRWELSEKSSK